MPNSDGQPARSGDRVKRRDDGTFATLIAVELDRPEVGQDEIEVKRDVDEERRRMSRRGNVKSWSEYPTFPFTEIGKDGHPKP